MSGCSKVYLITRDQLAHVMRGEARVRNLPADAEIIALQSVASERGEDLTMRVHSKRFPCLPHGAQMPVVVAVTEAVKA